MRVLFVSYMAPCFNEFYPLVSHMKESGLFEPVVYFNHGKEHASHQMDICLHDDVIALEQSGQRIAPEDPEKQNANKKNIPAFDWAVNFCYRVLRRFSYEVKRPFLFLFGFIYSLTAEFFHLLKRRKAINKILREYCIKGVVLGFDMAGRDSGLIVRECHKLGIPVVTLTWIFASGEDPAHVYYNEKVYPEYQASAFFNRLLVKYFPKYLYSYCGVEIVRLPAFKAIWYELLGIGAPLPWVFNSGKSDSIIVDSVAMLHYYEKAGIPSSQLKLTGMPIQDRIASVLMNKGVNKHKLCDEYGFNCNKPILMTAIVPNCFHMKNGLSTCEFSSYEELTKFWMGSIKQLNDKFNIIATIHPETPQIERDRLEQKYGIKIINATTSTADVIPLCDLYVTSISSTMRWAIACGIPVIDYQVHGVVNQFGPAPGVVCVKSKKDFLATLDMLLDDDDYLSDLKKRQESVAGDFGKLDGMACKRISELLANHIETYHKKVGWRSQSQLG